MTVALHLLLCVEHRGWTIRAKKERSGPWTESRPKMLVVQNLMVPGDIANNLISLFFFKASKQDFLLEQIQGMRKEDSMMILGFLA